MTLEGFLPVRFPAPDSKPRWGSEGTEPEAKGFVFWGLREEGCKVAGVVGVAHLFEWRLEALLLEGWSGRGFPCALQVRGDRGSIPFRCSRWSSRIFGEGRGRLRIWQGECCGYCQLLRVARSLGR